MKLYDSGVYLVNGKETVSYTHLDVYKRQILAWRQTSLIPTGKD